MFLRIESLGEKKAVVVNTKMIEGIYESRDLPLMIDLASGKCIQLRRDEFDVNTITEMLHDDLDVVTLRTI